MAEVRKFEDEMTQDDVVRTDAEYEAHEARGRLDEAQARAAALVSSAAALTAIGPQAQAEPIPPKGHGRHPFCQPGDEPNQVWMLRFSDPDLRTMIWTDENARRDAVEAWNRFNPAYNCYLFATVDRSPPPGPTEDRARIGALEAGLAGFDDEYMTSEKHHPGHVLIPVEVFERVRALLSGSTPNPARRELTEEKVAEIIREHFYPGPVTGSTARLAAALAAALSGGA